MTTGTPDRGPLTEELLTALSAVVDFVGDVVAPDTAGWQNQPGADGSVFIPYVVVTPMPSQKHLGSLDDSQSDWMMAYTLTTYGVTRRQIEDVADDARRAVLGLRKSIITMRDGVTQWKVMNVESKTIGGIGFSDAIKPTAYSQSDSALVWISKQL